jgi:hypothetical protein
MTAICCTVHVSFAVDPTRAGRADAMRVAGVVAERGPGDPLVTVGAGVGSTGTDALGPQTIEKGMSSIATTTPAHTEWSTPGVLMRAAHSTAATPAATNVHLIADSMSRRSIISPS